METLTSQTGDNKIRCVRMGMARRIVDLIRSLDMNKFTVQQELRSIFMVAVKSYSSCFFSNYTTRGERSARKYIAGIDRIKLNLANCGGLAGTAAKAMHKCIVSIANC